FVVVALLFSAFLYLRQAVPTISSVQKCIVNANNFPDLEKCIDAHGLNRIHSDGLTLHPEDIFTLNSKDVSWVGDVQQLPKDAKYKSISAFDSIWDYLMSEEPSTVFVVATEDEQILGYLVTSNIDE
ncbi:MAG: hypothetical protein V3V10_01860, partial [Planctomycetota bacterium]